MIVGAHITLNRFEPLVSDGECSQVIIHPAISVWAVSTMPNGDIVSGTSDGVVRVFSQQEGRWASEPDLKVRIARIVWDVFARINSFASFLTR